MRLKAKACTRKSGSEVEIEFEVDDEELVKLDETGQDRLIQRLAREAIEDSDLIEIWWEGD